MNPLIALSLTQALFVTLVSISLSLGLQAQSPGPVTSPKPTASPKPTGSPSQTVSPSPTNSPKPGRFRFPWRNRSPKPGNSPSPTVSPSPVTSPKPTASPKPTGSPSPIVSPRPTDSPKPSRSRKRNRPPQPENSPSPTVSPQPANSPKPMPSSSPVNPANRGVPNVGLQPVTNKNPNKWQGDFDGDGKPDALQLVTINPSFQRSDKMQLFNFWDKAAPKLPLPLALSIQHSDDRKEFIVYANTYFQSPIWTAAQVPLEIIQRGTPIHKLWQKQVKALKSDAIVIGTEAGIDTLLYWDGKTYRLYIPPEQP